MTTLLFLMLLAQSEAGWKAVGPGATIVSQAAGAVELEYAVGAGMKMAILPFAGKDVSHASSLRFRMRTEVATVLVVVISEKAPGGNYSAVCWSTGDQWQDVEIPLDHFRLNDGPNDPKDPDGKLDRDGWQRIGILDLNTAMTAKTENPSGKQRFAVEGFEVWSGAAPQPKDTMALDDFRTPQLEWLTRNQVELRPENTGLRAKYVQQDGMPVSMSHFVTGADLSGSSRLAFDVSSEQPASLVMSLEESAPGQGQGPRYNATIEVPGGGKATHFETLLSAFEHGPESPGNPNGGLDLKRLKMITIVDITGLQSPETVKNSLWISNIRGVARKEE